MKRIWMISLLIACLALVLTACGSHDSSQNREGADSDHIQIVATIFPEYDWVQNILGDNPADADVTLLMDSGVDLHSFQPTSEDMMKISTCDLFIYVGGESDQWVADALKESVNKDMITLNLLEQLGDLAKEEEIVEGMEPEEEEEGEEEEEAELDEHVWLSLHNASSLCAAIENALAEIDPGNASAYEDNLKDYQAQLEELDQQYRDAVSQAKVKTLLFGDRFPFRYMTDEYGLDYYAAFAGCSAESEASFETIQFLAKKMDELQLAHIMTIDNSDQKIAETVIRTTTAKDQTILSLNSMQAVTAEDVGSGETYLGIMKDNLTVLKEALQAN